MESDSEGTDSDDVFKPKPARNARPAKRRRLFDSDAEDVYEQENEVEPEDGGWDNQLAIIHADRYRYGRLHCPRRFRR
jgi:hypothetical protein